MAQANTYRLQLGKDIITVNFELINIISAIVIALIIWLAIRDTKPPKD